MHNATKILVKLVMSLVYMTSIGLVVNFVPDYLLRFLYVLMLGIGFMIAEMILWPPETSERSELARSMWRRFLFVVLKSIIIAGALVGFLVAFTTGESRFIVIEGSFIMVNSNYLIVYIITWLVMLVITNVIAVA